MCSDFVSYSDSSSMETNSASLSQAQRQIKALQSENQQLRNELHEIRCMYKQLIGEGAHEKYDERRVNFLKAHIIQLERQALLLTEALGCRSDVILEVDNAVTAIADSCRSYLSVERKVGEVTIPKSEVQSIIETAESARIKLYKTQENTSSERLKRPLLLMEEFVRQRAGEPVTLMDVCSGRIEHLNLKHVAKLESRLSQVYKLLSGLGQSLLSIVSPGKDVANQEVPKAVYTKIACQVLNVSSLLKKVNSDILALSVLVPAAPWPALRKSYMEELTADHVTSSLPGLSKTKNPDAKKAVASLLKAMNYATHMASLEKSWLKEEVEFHQAVYKQQMDYIETIFQAQRESYKLFEDSANELLCRPLQEILKRYKMLELSASEDALREFLQYFKQYSIQLSDAVDKLSVKDTSEREEALSAFAKQFFDTVNRMKEDCKQRRDELTDQIQVTQEQHEQLKSEIRKFYLADDTLQKVSTTNDDKEKNEKTPERKNVEKENRREQKTTERGRAASTVIKDERPPWNNSWVDEQDDLISEPTLLTTTTSRTGSPHVACDSGKRRISGDLNNSNLNESVVTDCSDDVRNIGIDDTSCTCGAGHITTPDKPPKGRQRTTYPNQQCPQAAITGGKSTSGKVQQTCDKQAGNPLPTSGIPSPGQTRLPPSSPALSKLRSPRSPVRTSKPSNSDRTKHVKGIAMSKLVLKPSGRVGALREGDTNLNVLQRHGATPADDQSHRRDQSHGKESEVGDCETQSSLMQRQRSGSLPRLRHASPGVKSPSAKDAHFGFKRSPFK